jgi:Restriction endonuclease
MTTTAAGKKLETFVSLIESHLLPSGFSVETNKKIYGDSRQEAEFDVLVKGKLGSTSIQWLIECRDRPSAGAADVAWIEQLVGRKDRFNLNKITAVSTTGFSPSAKKYAIEKDIEIREIQSIDVNELSKWLTVRSIKSRKRVTNLLHAKLLLSEDASTSIQEATVRFVESTGAGEKICCWNGGDSRSTLREAFFILAQKNTHWFDQVVPGTTLRISVIAQYDHSNNELCVETDIGMVAIPNIEFVAELSIEDSDVQIVETHEYRQMDEDVAITQTATFEAQNILGMSMALELHNIVGSGETIVTMRRIA